MAALRLRTASVRSYVRLSEVIENDDSWRSVHKLDELAELMLADAGVERKVKLSQPADPRDKRTRGEKTCRLVLHVATYANDNPLTFGEMRCEADEGLGPQLKRSMRDHATDHRPTSRQRLDPRDLSERLLRATAGFDDDKSSQATGVRVKIV